MLSAILGVSDSKEGVVKSLVIPSSRQKRSPEQLSMMKAWTALPSGNLNASGKSRFFQNFKSQGKAVQAFFMKGGDGKSWNISAQAPPKLAIPKSMNLYEITLVQEVHLGTVLTTSAAVATFSASYFTPSSLGNYSNLSAVFDQYKVEQLELWYTPEVFGSNAVSSFYTSVIDLDDEAVMTAYTQAGEYGSAVETLIADGQYRKWVPHIAVATYSGAFTSYKNERAGWIDAGSPNVRHYGSKLAAQTAATTIEITGNLRVVMSWRSTH